MSEPSGMLLFDVKVLGERKVQRGCQACPRCHMLRRNFVVDNATTSTHLEVELLPQLWQTKTLQHTVVSLN